MVFGSAFLTLPFFLPQPPLPLCGIAALSVLPHLGWGLPHEESPRRVLSEDTHLLNATNEQTG
jgi:hypothetical protein